MARYRSNSGPLARIGALTAAGIPEEPFHQLVTLYRTTSGKKLHLGHECSRLGSNRAYRPVQVDLFKSAGDHCNCVTDIPSGPVATYAKAAGLIIEVEKLVAGLDGKLTNVTLDNLAFLRQMRKQLAAQGDVDPAIADRFAAAAGSVEQMLASEELATLAGEAVELIKARCARSLLAPAGGRSYPSDKEVKPPHEEVDLILYDADGLSYSRNWKPLSKAWQVWSERLERRDVPAAARQAAIAAGIEAAGNNPERLSQVPVVPRYRPERFATVGAWAAAEWREAVADHMTGMLSRWEAAVAAKLAELDGPDHTLAISRRAGYSDAPEPGAAVLNLLGPFPRVDGPGLILVRVPAVVAAWLVALSKTEASYNQYAANRWEVADLGAVPAQTDFGYLEVAASLHGDGTKVADAVEMALLSTLPASNAGE